MSTPPKRDKFAALAARQGQQQVRSTSPKPDKFSAMAARQGNPAAAPVPAPVPPPAPSTVPNPTPVPVVSASTVSAPTAAAQAAANRAAPRRDKFAALRRDKFAAVQQQEESSAAPSSTEAPTATISTITTTTVSTTKEQDEQQKQKTALLQKRSAQRDAIWKDLDKAEELVVELLGVAEATAQALSTANNLQELPSQYQRLLEQIHARLRPHSQHVHAYKEPQEINRMYQTRVEWRLAEGAKEVLQEYLHLEKQGVNKREGSTTDNEIPSKQVKLDDDGMIV